MSKNLPIAVAFASAVLFAAPVMAADTMSPDTMSPDASAPGGAASTPPGGITAAQLVGREVVDSTGAKVGKIKDVQTDAQGNNQIIVNVGKKSVAVPAGELQVASNDKIQSSRTAKELKALPAAQSGASGGGSATPN